jgi:hypothetical protein
MKRLLSTFLAFLLGVNSLLVARPGLRLQDSTEIASFGESFNQIQRGIQASCSLAQKIVANKASSLAVQGSDIANSVHQAMFVGLGRLKEAGVSAQNKLSELQSELSSQLSRGLDAASQRAQDTATSVALYGKQAADGASQAVSAGMCQFKDSCYIAQNKLSELRSGLSSQLSRGLDAASQFAQDTATSVALSGRQAVDGVSQAATAGMCQFKDSCNVAQNKLSELQSELSSQFRVGLDMAGRLAQDMATSVALSGRQAVDGASQAASAGMCQFKDSCNVAQRKLGELPLELSSQLRVGFDETKRVVADISTILENGVKEVTHGVRESVLTGVCQLKDSCVVAQNKLNGLKSSVSLQLQMGLGASKRVVADTTTTFADQVKGVADFANQSVIASIGAVRDSLSVAQNKIGELPSGILSQLQTGLDTTKQVMSGVATSMADQAKGISDAAQNVVSSSVCGFKDTCFMAQNAFNDLNAGIASQLHLGFNTTRNIVENTTSGIVGGVRGVADSLASAKNTVGEYQSELLSKAYAGFNQTTEAAANGISSLALQGKQVVTSANDSVVAAIGALRDSIGAAKDTVTEIPLELVAQVQAGLDSIRQRAVSTAFSVIDHGRDVALATQQSVASGLDSLKESFASLSDQLMRQKTEPILLAMNKYTAPEREMVGAQSTSHKMKHFFARAKMKLVGLKEKFSHNAMQKELMQDKSLAELSRQPIQITRHGFGKTISLAQNQPKEELEKVSKPSRFRAFKLHTSSDALAPSNNTVSVAKADPVSSVKKNTEKGKSFTELVQQSLAAAKNALTGTIVVAKNESQNMESKKDIKSEAPPVKRSRIFRFFKEDEVRKPTSELIRPIPQSVPMQQPTSATRAHETIMQRYVAQRPTQPAQVAPYMPMQQMPQMQFAVPQQHYNSPSMQQSYMLAMQASMMAMQAQNSILMAQAQPNQMPFAAAPMMATPPSGRILSKQEKIQQVKFQLQQLALRGELALKPLLHLIDLEFDILECLLAGNTGSTVDQAVQERDAVVKTSDPQVVALYDNVMDLTTTYGEGDTGSLTYRYCIRKSKKPGECGIRKDNKKFIMGVMYELEKQYAQIEDMLNRGMILLP